MFEEMIKIFGGLLTPLIALLVVYIAYQQHKTNRDKLRLDLFDKRYAVYKGTQNFLSLVARKAECKIENLVQFNRETQDAIFLFGDEIPDYLGSIWSNASDLIATTAKYQLLPGGKERSSLAEKEREIFDCLLEKLKELKNVFAPYLKFEMWK